MGGKRSRAVAAVCLVALGAAGGASALTGGSTAAGADESAKRGAAKGSVVRASVVSKNRRNIARLSYLRVRVRSPKGASLRVFGVARRRARGARAYRVTRTRRVRMRRRGTRIVRLRLTRAGKRVLGGCRNLSVRPGGRARIRGARRGRRLRVSARRLRPVGLRCRLVPGGNGLDAPPGNPRPLGKLDTANASRCDFLDPSLCLYPFPNDHFTRADTSTPTKRRLNLNIDSVPKNRAGKPIDPTDQNRADGFSPGNKIITRVPGLDSQAAFATTGAVPITDMARSFDASQPVVVVNARTHERQVIWAEIDSNPKNPRDVTLLIRPGKNFEEGERYIVALRRLKNAEGETLGPRDEFRAYRDGLTTNDAAIERRRVHYEGIFDDLALSDIARRDLYLAWDFTVASRQSLTDRAVSIRDDAFRQLGDTTLADFQVQGAAPQFVMNPDIDDDIVDGADEIPTGPIPKPVDFADFDGRRDFTPEENPNTARRITGQITVPCYLDQPGCPPGSGFTLGADGKPQRAPGNTALANVICTIPQSAVLGADPPRARPGLYGHGLLGGGTEVGAGNVQAMGQEHGFVWCATDWIGMSTTDVPNVLKLLQDLSSFNTLADRIQQGYVNFMYLGRWMIHPDGASADPAFQVNGRSVIDTQRLYYDGNSQGGILSGGLTALTPDFERAVHGVPGMNYSTLLRRSVDFDTYANGDFEGAQVPAGLYQNYPNELERPLILSLIQLLWDRGESNGYAQHMTSDPLPNSPRHQVLLHPAFGDHQVAIVTADVEARTIGASTNANPLYPGRSPDVTPLFGIPTAAASGFTGSAIVYWDGGPPGRLVEGQERGTPAPPTTNVPPREGKDPHSYPRSDVKARQQKSEFLRVNGTLINPCGFGPCYSDGFTGP